MIGPVSRALSVFADVMDPEQRALAAETLRNLEGDTIDRNFFHTLAISLEQLTESQSSAAPRASHAADKSRALGGPV
jgi:hypothetical protein